MRLERKNEMIIFFFAHNFLCVWIDLCSWGRRFLVGWPSWRNESRGSIRPEERALYRNSCGVVRPIQQLLALSLSSIYTHTLTLGDSASWSNYLGSRWGLRIVAFVVLSLIFSIPSLLYCRRAGRGHIISASQKEEDKWSESFAFIYCIHRRFKGPTYNIHVLTAQHRMKWSFFPDILLLICSTRVVLNEWRKSSSLFCLNK